MQYTAALLSAVGPAGLEFSKIANREAMLRGQVILLRLFRCPARTLEIALFLAPIAPVPRVERLGCIESATRRINGPSLRELWLTLLKLFALYLPVRGQKHAFSTQARESQQFRWRT